MKKSLYLVLLLVFMMLFASCGNSKMSEKELLSDIKAYLYYEVLGENEKLAEVEIIDRQTDKKEKQDTTKCKIITEDEKYRYKREAVFVLVLNDENEWCLNDFSEAGQEKWTITPLSGVNKEQIAVSLKGMSFTANNEIWDITDENIESISIVDQKTDLAALTDTVTAKVIVNDKVQKASGQVVIHYTFEDKWVLDSMSENENFTTETKAGLALDVTEESLLDVLSEQVFEYGVNDKQEITLNKDELSGFSIEKKESSQKGSLETYYCNGTLTKPHAVFSLEIEVPYYYSDTWELQPISVTANCTSVDIAGKWTGSNDYGHSCELDITEIDANGNIKATYSDKGDQFNEPFSYYVSGNIDLNNLRMDLEAGDIISGLDHWGAKADDITAWLRIDSSTIFGRARLQFRLSQ